MAGGKRYKFQGSTIQFSVDFHADSPSDAIGSITKADPAVVTSTGHGRADADVVKLTVPTGMTELDGELFVINVVDANSYQLLDVDSSAYGTYVSGGRVNVATFSALCELTGFNRQGGSSPEIPATSICSTAAEFELGLPDFGSVQIDYNFAPGVSVQRAIEAAYRSGEKIAVKVTLPNNGGILVMLGFVQQTSEAVQVNGIWTASMTLRLTGPRQDFLT